MLFTFLGILNLQLGYPFKLSNISGKGLLSFLFSLVQTQGYFFFYLLIPNFKTLIKKCIVLGRTSEEARESREGSFSGEAENSWEYF